MHGFVAACDGDADPYPTAHLTVPSEPMLCFSITGFEPDPDLVTETLGITPTLVRRRGIAGQSKRPSTFNGWWLDAHEDRLVDGAQHSSALNHILGQLRGRIERFATLRDLIKPQSMTIYGGIYVPADEQCGIWLDSGQMQLLASCGIGWGVDLFVMTPASE